MSDEKDLAMPEGLSPRGEKAYRAIMKFLKARGLTGTQGCKVFYSPEEWKERGEQYGTESVLVVVYDGADARRCFSMDACYERARPGTNCYEPFEALQEELGKLDMYSQECTGWYSAVYAN